MYRNLARSLKGKVFRSGKLVVLDTTNKLSYIILPFSQRLPVNPLTHLQMKPFPFRLQLPPCWQGLFLHGSVAEHERVIFIIVA